MYLVNPLYFISNVVYINVERRYIYIERRCWNTMVNLIWKTRHPELHEVRQLKELCYDVYVKYMENQSVDFQYFNSQVAKFQIEEFNFEALGLTDPEVVEEEKPKEVVFNEESCLYVEEYINEKNTLDLPLPEKQKLLKYNSQKEHFIKDVELFLNYMLSSNIETESLVNLVGYARAKSIFQIIFQSHRYILNNNYEKLLVKQGFKFGLAKALIKATSYQDCLNCQSSAKCNNHISVVFMCSICEGVNCHKVLRGPKRMASPCGGYLYVFDEYGEFEPTDENGNTFANPQKITCYGQEFNINDNVNLRSIEFNHKALKELESNYSNYIIERGTNNFITNESITLDNGKVVNRVNFSFTKNDSELLDERKNLGIFLKSETYHFNSLVSDYSLHVINSKPHLIYGIDDLMNFNFIDYDKSIDDRITTQFKLLKK